MAVKWAKKGEAAVAAIAQDEEQKKLEAAKRQKLWRFYLKSGDKAQITFVDGDVTPEGHLDALMYREHMVFHNGKWDNFVCVADDEPCPLCESGDTPTLVAALTIIDHREVDSTKNKGTVYKDTPKLFVFKPATFKILQAMAVKRNGLANCTFEITRTGDKAAAVGDVFDFEVKHTDTKALRQKYFREVEVTEGVNKGKMKKVTNFVPADYEQELPYYPALNLREMGFGSDKMNHSKPVTHKASAPVEDDFEEDATSSTATNFDDEL